MIRAGSNKATNNDSKYLDLKIQLRLDAVKKFESVNVLDCFAGDSVLWKKVYEKTNTKINRFKIDADNRYNVDFIGNSLKYIKNNNIDDFNIIDLDSWGSPVQHLEIIFKSNFKGIVVCTYCSPVLMNPDKILAKTFYGDIYETCNKKTLLNKDIGLMFKSYLFKNNIKNYNGLISKKKIYCSFEIK
jgi:hypothetical protein